MPWNTSNLLYVFEGQKSDLGLARLISKCQEAAAFLSGGCRGTSVFLLIWVVGSTQFAVIVVVRPHCLAGCQLSALLSFAGQPVFFIMTIICPPLQPATAGRGSFALGLSLPPPTPFLWPGKVLSFYGLLWWGGAHQVIQDNLLISWSTPVFLSAKSFGSVRSIFRGVWASFGHHYPAYHSLSLIWL